MTILNDKDRFIQFSLSEKIKKNKTTTNNTTYTPELPTIVCSEEMDAIHIQSEINIFTNKLIKNVLNKE